MSIIFSLILIVVAGLLTSYAYLYFWQRHILYLPVEQMAEPHNYGMQDTELVKLKTADGVDIITWFTPPKHNEVVLLYFQGNAGNLGDRAEKFKVFTHTGMGMLAVSWRGYGGSGGSPTEEGLYADARAGIDYLVKRGYGLDRIVFYGESLGSGVAVQMATEYTPKALVLEAPYTSVANRAKEKYPFVPVHLLLKDHFDSISKIGKVHVPLLIMHGYLDQTMPISHGRRLLEAANEPKEARFFDHVGHTDFNLPEIAGITQEFARKAGK